MYQKKMSYGGWRRLAGMGDATPPPILCPPGQSPFNTNVTGLMSQDQWICSQNPGGAGASSAPGTVTLPIIGTVPTTYALIGGGIAAFLLLRKG